MTRAKGKRNRDKLIGDKTSICPTATGNLILTGDLIPPEDPIPTGESKTRPGKRKRIPHTAGDSFGPVVNIRLATASLHKHFPHFPHRAILEGWFLQVTPDNIL